MSFSSPEATRRLLDHFHHTMLTQPGNPSVEAQLSSYMVNVSVEAHNAALDLAIGLLRATGCNGCQKAMKLIEGEKENLPGQTLTSQRNDG